MGETGVPVENPSMHLENTHTLKIKILLLRFDPVICEAAAIITVHIQGKTELNTVLPVCVFVCHLAKYFLDEF